MTHHIVSFTTTIFKLQHLSMYYIEVNKSIVKKLGGSINIRLLCTVNNKLTYQCGLVSLGEGNAYISINSKRMKQLGISLGDEVNVSLQKDESEYGMDMPEELEELLLQDEEGKRRFDKLSAGKQRYVIYYVAMVKSKMLRLERALMLIENLKKTKEGKETFREMLGKS